MPPACPDSPMYLVKPRFALGPGNWPVAGPCEAPVLGRSAQLAGWSPAGREKPGALSSLAQVTLRPSAATLHPPAAKQRNDGPLPGLYAGPRLIISTLLPSRSLPWTLVPSDAMPVA